MPENHSRAGKRVERLSVTDEPHDNYRNCDPWTGEELNGGIPILNNTVIGNVLKKDITHYVVNCPECGSEARYDDESDPICPDCGVVCTGNGERTSEIIIDAKAAGRIDDDSEVSA